MHFKVYLPQQLVYSDIISNGSRCSRSAIEILFTNFNAVDVRTNVKDAPNISSIHASNVCHTL